MTSPIDAGFIASYLRDSDGGPAALRFAEREFKNPAAPEDVGETVKKP